LHCTFPASRKLLFLCVLIAEVIIVLETLLLFFSGLPALIDGIMQENAINNIGSLISLEIFYT